MRFAFTMAQGRGDTDLILQQVATSLISAGIRPAGIVQMNTDRADAGPCDMDVRVLPEGPRLRISQSLGRNARGCRLDPKALETSVGLVQATLAASDCVIVNKFGKHEADGRGFRPVIAEAVSLGLPVLVGLNSLNAAAFHEFSGGLADQLPPTADILLEWLHENTNQPRAVAYS